MHVVAGMDALPELPPQGPHVINVGRELLRANVTQRPARRPARVQRLGHVVLQSTRYRRALDWYLDNLGMIVSDFLFYPGQRDRGPTMSFIRCDRGGQPADHHSIVGLLSCAVPPLAWGHHRVWSVPLLACVLDRAVRTRGRVRVAWAACVGATYLTVFMWFTAWVFRASRTMQTQYPNYSAAMSAAVGQMTKPERILVVATHPALLIVAAAATIWVTRSRGVRVPRLST